MSLKAKVEEHFEGCNPERIKYILQQLQQNGISTDKDLCYLHEELLIRLKFETVEIKKLLELKSDVENELAMIIRKIFFGESQMTIRKIKNILTTLSVYQADHLVLALDKIEAHPEIKCIDKRKISQYVSKHFIDEYEEFRLNKKRECDDERQTKSNKHDLSMKKLDITEIDVQGKCREKEELMSQRGELVQKLMKANEGKWYTWNSTREDQVKRLADSIKTIDFDIKKLDESLLELLPPPTTQNKSTRGVDNSRPAPIDFVSENVTATMPARVDEVSSDIIGTFLIRKNWVKIMARLPVVEHNYAVMEKIDVLYTAPNLPFYFLFSQ